MQEGPWSWTCSEGRVRSVQKRCNSMSRVTQKAAAGHLQDLQEQMQEVEVQEEHPEEERIPRRAQEETVTEEIDIGTWRKQIETKLTELQQREKQMEENFATWLQKTKQMEEFINSAAAGGKAFVGQRQIQDMMREVNSVDKWRTKSISETADDLTMVQSRINDDQEFAAAKQLQGLVEVVNAAKEITAINPTATSWIKKAIDEAIGIALRLRKEHGGL